MFTFYRQLTQQVAYAQGVLIYTGSKALQNTKRNFEIDEIFIYLNGLGEGRIVLLKQRSRQDSFNHEFNRKTCTMWLEGNIINISGISHPSNFRSIQIKFENPVRALSFFRQMKAFIGVLVDWRNDEPNRCPPLPSLTERVRRRIYRKAKKLFLNGWDDNSYFSRSTWHPGNHPPLTIDYMTIPEPWQDIDIIQFFKRQKHSAYCVKCWKSKEEHDDLEGIKLNFSRNDHDIIHAIRYTTLNFDRGASVFFEMPYNEPHCHSTDVDYFHPSVQLHTAEMVHLAEIRELVNRHQIIRSHHPEYFSRFPLTGLSRFTWCFVQKGSQIEQWLILCPIDVFNNNSAIQAFSTFGFVSNGQHWSRLDTVLCIATEQSPANSLTVPHQWKNNNKHSGYRWLRLIVIDETIIHDGHLVQLSDDTKVLYGTAVEPILETQNKVAHGAQSETRLVPIQPNGNEQLHKSNPNLAQPSQTDKNTANSQHYLPTKVPGQRQVAVVAPMIVQGSEVPNAISRRKAATNISQLPNALNMIENVETMTGQGWSRRDKMLMMIGVAFTLMLMFRFVSPEDLRILGTVSEAKEKFDQVMTILNALASKTGF